jgi:hypothetical protein
MHVLYVMYHRSHATSERPAEMLDEELDAVPDWARPAPPPDAEVAPGRRDTGRRPKGWGDDDDEAELTSGVAALATVRSTVRRA